MPNLINANLPPPSLPLPRYRIILHWIAKYAAIEIAVVLALAIAGYFLGHHLFNGVIPSQGDVRSHVFKIELLQSYLSHFSWPQWNPYWYQGIPEDQYYPPGFYLLGAILGFVFKNGVVAYKILLLLDMVLNGLLIYLFARRFLKFNAQQAVWSLIAYETSTPLLINFFYGEGPNLLGWSVTLGFLTLYLSHALENRTARLTEIALPGLLLGIAILIHPFPVIFAIMAAVLFHIIWLVHSRDWRAFLQSHLPYSVGVFIIGGLIGMYYWLPALVTLPFSSPIYSFTKFQWPGGTLYLLALVLLALVIFILVRLKVRADSRLDFLFAGFALASALGFGATQYLPFGLGSLVQEFRFASIIIPFFAILLIIYPLKYRLFHFNAINLALAFSIGIFVTSIVFGLNSRDGFLAGFKALSGHGVSDYYQLVVKQFSAGFPNFAVTFFPYFTILIYFALSLTRKNIELKKERPTFILAAGACLMLMTSFIPYINTAKQINLGDLTRYIDNYEQPEYAQLMKSAQDERLIIPMNKGYLTEGDSPVTFGWRWGVKTVNGPYNQGDPKFFKFTVHLEWEERWLAYEQTRTNLMQESASRYIFIRGSNGLFNNTAGLIPGISNKYGRLMILNEGVSQADKVTPVLLDVKDARAASEFFNILLPRGYRLVLAEIQDVPLDLRANFKYVMVDNLSKINNYPGRTVFLLQDSLKPSITDESGIVHLNLPYQSYSNKIFYHGDEADGYMWLGWDAWPGSQITSDMQAGLEQCGNIILPYLNKLDYSPVDYRLDETRIELSTTPGFTLVKDSYFPYWKASPGKIVPTNQGFMLVYTGTDHLTLYYQKPFYYIFATICSVLALLLIIIILPAQNWLNHFLQRKPAH